MNLWIKGRERSINDAVNAFIEWRVIRKLSRASAKVRSIAISIRDVNGPRGGIDHVIRVIIWMKSGGNIVVRHRAPDPYAGVPIAIKRAVRAMRREVGRHRTNCREAYRRNLAEQAQC